MKRLVVLTGAGISAESGLATFRDPGGLWQRFRPQDLATPEAFARDPDLVLGWYDARRAQLAEVEPNPAHLALARLERDWPGDFLLVTQNVDDLHARAGSRRMVQMHGALKRVRCTACDARHDWQAALPRATPCPACGAARLRPDIVWFGEMPLEMPRIMAALEAADIFVAIGTSGTVYPAAGFVRMLPRHARSIEVNLEASAVADGFDELRQGPAGTLVPALVEQLLCAA
ncbi:NAD-dependent deacylase [Rhodovarius crocodyli]|nr:NAD-dependent deacylase [Rhodovarius crocodyli]